MKNYLLIHCASNLIVNAFEAFEPDQLSSQYRLIPVSDLVLEKYHVALARHKDGPVSMWVSSLCSAPHSERHYGFLDPNPICL